MRNFWKIVLIFLIGCQSEEYPLQLPIIKTEPIREITPMGTRFEGSVISSGKINIQNFGFVWSYQEGNKDEVFSDTLSGTWSEGSFSMQAENRLLKGKTYKVAFFAYSDKEKVFANEQEFISQGSSPPIITEIQPSEVFDGYEIEIKGKNFYTNKKYVQVYVADEPAEITYLSTTKLKVIVPPLAVSGAVDVRVIIDGQSSKLSQALKIIAPIISSISHSQGRVYDEIEIHGQNLGLPNVKTVVSFDDFGLPEAQIINSSTIRVRVPQAFIHPVPDGPAQLPVSIKVGLMVDKIGAVARFSKESPFIVINSWEKIMPDIPIRRGLSVTVNGLIYWVGASQDQQGANQVWSFNPDNLQWTRKSDLPGEDRWYHFVTASDSKIYVGASNSLGNLFYIFEYTVETDSWATIEIIESLFSPSLGQAPSSAIFIENKLFFVAPNMMHSYNLDDKILSQNLITNQMLGKRPFLTKIGNESFILMSQIKEYTDVVLFSALKYQHATETWNLLNNEFESFAYGSSSFLACSGLNSSVLFDQSTQFIHLFQPVETSPWKTNQVLRPGAPYYMTPTIVGNYLYISGYGTCCTELSLYKMQLH